MNKTLYILFLTMFLVSCDMSTGNVSKVEFATRIEALNPEVYASPQTEPILAKDYYIAKKALDKAIRDNDKSTIRLGLKGYSFQIRKDVVDEIKMLNDASFVPNLADALEANQGCLSGGSEADSFQRDLDLAIVYLLKGFTKLEFKDFKVSSSSSNSCVDSSYLDRIKQISEESRAWYKVHAVDATKPSSR